MTPALLMKDIRFSYGTGRGTVSIDHFEVAPSERIFLYGPSGVGKSTLLGLVAGTLSPQAGSVSVLGQDLKAIPNAKRDQFRAEHLGIIFQLFNLIPYLSVLDNVLLPLKFSPTRKTNVTAEGAPKDVANRLLSRLGLGEDELKKRKVGELSVGQQQRVAAARALIGNPGLVIADEPTSALDNDSQAAFLDLLTEEVSRSEATLIFVSHNKELATHFDRSVNFEDLQHTTSKGVAQS